MKDISRCPHHNTFALPETFQVVTNLWFLSLCKEFWYNSSKPGTHCTDPTALCWNSFSCSHWGRYVAEEIKTQKTKVAHPQVWNQPLTREDGASMSLLASQATLLDTTIILPTNVANFRGKRLNETHHWSARHISIWSLTSLASPEFNKYEIAQGSLEHERTARQAFASPIFQTYH